MKTLLLNMKKAVETSSLSRSFLYEAIKAGDLKIIKIGSRTFIEPGELERFVTELIQQSEGAA
jgi:stalled ribosome rescue protein Dom34